jgi:autotransporter-associated beta strand protein
LTPAGVNDLYLYYYSTGTAPSALTIYSQISDNSNGTPGNQSVRLDAWGGTWGAGTIIVANNTNSYTGGTVINQENVQIGVAGAPGNLPAGGITVNGGNLTQVNGTIAAQDVTINGGGGVTLLGNNTLGNIIFNDNGGSSTPTLAPTGVLTVTGSITSSSSNVATIANIGPGTLDLGGNNSFLMTVNPVDPFGTGANVAPLQSGLTISALIQHGGILKMGNGTLMLSNAANSYTGATTILAGRLELGVAGAIPNTSSVVIGSNGTFDLTGFSETVGSLAGDTPTTGGVVTDSGAAATLAVGDDNTNTTFAGAIVNGPGAVALTKVGSGTQTLSGVSTYTGPTLVSAGEVIVSGSISGTSSVSVGGGATAAILRTTGSITTPGSITVANHGVLSGAGTINGALTVGSGGTLEPDASVSSLTVAQGSVALQSGSTFQLALSNSNASIHGAPDLGDYSTLTLGTGVTASLGGTIVTDVTGQLNAMDLFTIILSGAPVTGVFANTTPVTGSTYAFSSGGESYEINYAFNSGTYSGTQTSFETDSGGTSVAVLVLAVPEPNSWAMLVGSLGVALGLQRFRRRRVSLS